MTKSKDVFNSRIRVPFFAPYISRCDKKTILKALNSSLLTDGPNLRKFESMFANFTGSKYAVGVSNATSALHLSLISLGIGKDDEVIVPNMTFVATINAVILTGATPVLADVDDELNLSPNSVLENVTKKTKAIIPVHFAGKMSDILSLKKITKKHDLFMIEDCAHALGTKLGNKHAGTFGNVGCFSFYPTKNITTIEGGMVVTNSKKIARYIRSLRNHGISKTLFQRYNRGRPWDYEVIEPGYNYRLDEIRSSLGLSQLQILDKLNEKRKKSFQYYNKNLKQINGIKPLSEDVSEHACHLYIIRIKREFGISRDRLFERLLNKGIRTSVHYKPLSMFSVYRRYAKSYGNLNNSEKAYEEILSLPFYPHISKTDLDLVIRCIKDNSVI